MKNSQILNNFNPSSILLLFPLILLCFLVTMIYLQLNLNKERESRDNLNKKVVVTTSQKNENNIALILKNPLNTDIKNIGLTCQTTVLSGDVVKTYANIFDKIPANTTKTITVTQLTYGYDNTPVDIRQVTAIQCNVSKMIAQDAHA